MLAFSKHEIYSFYKRLGELAEIVKHDYKEASAYYERVYEVLEEIYSSDRDELAS